MDGKLILGFLNYLFFGLIFVFGLIALLVRDQRKKLTFLFLALLSAGSLKLFIFCRNSFYTAGNYTGIFLPASLYVYCQPGILWIRKTLCSGREDSASELQATQGSKGFRIKPSLAINFVLSLAVSAGAGVIFFIYNKDFLKGLQLVESFKAATTGDIINNIGANYIPAILVICAALFSSVFWFISILENRRTKN